jgi:hypothetical protein
MPLPQQTVESNYPNWPSSRDPQNRRNPIHCSNAGILDLPNRREFEPIG